MQESSPEPDAHDAKGLCRVTMGLIVHEFVVAGRGVSGVEELENRTAEEIVFSARFGRRVRVG